jgi:hypothetical protein
MEGIGLFYQKLEKDVLICARTEMNDGHIMLLIILRRCNPGYRIRVAAACFSLTSARRQCGHR